MNHSELVVVAKEIHERVLDKIENKESFSFVYCSENTEICMQIKPEFINVSKDMYEISDGLDSSIHIELKEVEHIYKEDEVDGFFYSISFKNGTQMIIIL